MVSVILPTYNGKQYLKQSVESVLNQTYTDLELIIVDDCSTDGTGELLDEIALKESRIRVIHNEINKKLPASLNIGFSHAKGEFFTWTSDDNFYTRDAIDKLVQYLISTPQVDIVYADYNLINEHGDMVCEVIHKETDSIYEDNVVGACFLYRRRVQDCLKGYNENLFLVEDYDFWLRAYENFTFGQLHEKLYYYRRHVNSLTGTKMMDIVNVTNSVLIRVLNNTSLKEEDRVILLKRISMNVYNFNYDRNVLRKYMQLLKLASVKAYKNCGNEMIYSQLVPKKIVKKIGNLLGRFSIKKGLN